MSKILGKYRVQRNSDVDNGEILLEGVSMEASPNAIKGININAQDFK